MGFRKFEVDDKQFTIKITRVGPLAARMAQIAFYRITDYVGPCQYTKIITKTGGSHRQVFRILSEVVNWSVSWILRNKTFARTYIVISELESSRVNIYEKYVSTKAEFINHKYVRGEFQDSAGTSKAVFIIYDPDYLKNNPTYNEILNKTINDMFKISL